MDLKLYGLKIFKLLLLSNFMDVEALDRYSEEVLPEFEQDLLRLVKIPSVSGEAERKDDVRKCAIELKNLLSRMGVDAELAETVGHPLVWGVLGSDPDQPTLALYNHYDVQPAKKEDGWATEPFEPVVKDGAIYGRGATDDKGPMLTTLKAVKHLHETDQLKVNLMFVYEGEEESGSENFGTALKLIRDSTQRSIDGVLITDTEWFGGRPTITTSLRGIVYANLVCESGTRGMHSGETGGVVVDPLVSLSHAVAACVDLDGRVKIPGFYDDVKLLTAEQEAELGTLDYDVEKFLADKGVLNPTTKDKFEILKRTLYMPTFTEHGQFGAYSGDATKTEIPARVARKVSMRLVPNQDPQRVAQSLREYIRDVNSNIRVEIKDTLPPFVVNIDHPYMQAAFQAAQDGFGKRPIYIGCGGSIGAPPEFVRVFGNVPVIMPALSREDDGYHSTDENYKLKQAEGGIRAIGRFLYRVGELGRVVA